MLTLQGKPFSLKGREYLLPIYNKNMKAFLLRTGRQVEKSTTLAGHMLSRVLLIPYFQALYVSPSSEQTRAFSSQKLQPFIKHSDFIQKYFVNSKLTNRVYEKEFLNGSRIMLAYAFLTADRIRGKSADAVYVDEVQDMLSDNLPVIEETLSHSQYKYRLYAGTPKHRQSVIEDLWLRSSQNEWVIKCDACGHENILSENNISKKGLVCERCGAPLDPKKGRWVPQNDSATIEGFRIPQLMVPWIEWDEILRKYNEYSTAKFYNEVLGLPYDDAALAVQLVHLQNASTNDPMFEKYEPLYYHSAPLYMGIDWATATPDSGSYTVVVIGGFVHDRFHVCYMERFKGARADLGYVVPYLAQLAKKFRVAVVGADWGVGSGGANAQLRGLLGSIDKVYEYYYSSNVKELVKWDKRSMKFILNRTESLTGVFNKIKEGKITFPKFGDWSDYAQDFLNVYVDYNSRTGKIFYNKTPGKSDDFVHALNFAYLTGLIDRGIIKPTLAKITESAV